MFLALLSIALCASKHHRHHGRRHHVVSNDQTGRITATDGVNVRSGPGTGYSIIGGLVYGSTFTITGSSNGWYKLNYGGQTGYVCGDYVSVSGSSGGGGESSKTGIVTADVLNVRSGPGTSYSKIGSLTMGASVTVLSTSNGWCKIQYGSGTGYVSADYISFSSGGTGKGAQIIALARTKLGCPYVWGATGPSSFDCSGLVQWCHTQVGISIPRVSYDQAKAGRAISRGSEQPGDILCFCTDGASISHVGLYSGNNNFIHAPHSGDVVKEVSFSSYYTSAWRTSRRCW